MAAKKVQALFPSEGELDGLLVERVRVFWARMAHELRELEAYKLKRGICIGGISCTRKALEGKRGARRVCTHHKAARDSGIKLSKVEKYMSEYGQLRAKLREQEKNEAKKEQPKKRKKAA